MNTEQNAEQNDDDGEMTAAEVQAAIAAVLGGEKLPEGPQGLAGMSAAEVRAGARRVGLLGTATTTPLLLTTLTRAAGMLFRVRGSVGSGALAPTLLMRLQLLVAMQLLRALSEIVGLTLRELYATAGEGGDECSPRTDAKDHAGELVKLSAQYCICHGCTAARLGKVPRPHG